MLFRICFEKLIDLFVLWVTEIQEDLFLSAGDKNLDRTVNHIS